MCPFDHADRLIEVGRRLVCQEAARVLVPPRAAEPGFWFGSGNICRDGDGALLLCGRYRNGGDSRLGLRAGVRGFELAIFRSTDEGETFEGIAVADGTGTWSLDTGAPFDGPKLTATAIDPDGNTSEFGVAKRPYQVHLPVALRNAGSP